MRDSNTTTLQPSDRIANLSYDYSPDPSLLSFDMIDPIPCPDNCQRGTDRKNASNRVHDFTPNVPYRVFGISHCSPPEPRIPLAIIACAISLSERIRWITKHGFVCADRNLLFSIISQVKSNDTKSFIEQDAAGPDPWHSRLAWHCHSEPDEVCRDSW